MGARKVAQLDLGRLVILVGVDLEDVGLVLLVFGLSRWKYCDIIVWKFRANPRINISAFACLHHLRFVFQTNFEPILFCLRCSTECHKRCAPYANAVRHDVNIRCSNAERCYSQVLQNQPWFQFFSCSRLMRTAGQYQSRGK